MRLHNKEEGILERINKTAVPTLSAIAAIVALAKEGDPYIKYPAIAVSIFLSLVVLFPISLRAFQIIRSKLFPRKLSKAQKIKLTILLRESENYISTNHTYSLFYMWTSYAQRMGIVGGSYQDYHCAIRSHFMDMDDLVSKSNRDQLYLLRKMSLAVREVARAAEGMQREYENALCRGDVDESLRRQLRAEWNRCASKFNGWLAEWERLFKEANHFSGADCAEYIPAIRMLE